jgi:ABC-type amino acid transport substrate-binding protein
VQGPEDLPGVLVGTVRDSTSEAYLRQRNLRRRAYGDLHEALEALARHQVGAVVYDRPLLAWAVRQDPALDKDLVVLPRIFERQDYALALPQGSDRREAVNRVIVRLIKEPWWNEVLQRYTG